MGVKTMDDTENKTTEKNKTTAENRTIYCHFQFRRPKGKNYGLFAVALYNDFEGKKLIGHVTKRQLLWENHQFITGIQSYNFALDAIYQCQGKLKEYNVTQVMLVTDNSTLEGWIVNPKKNKNYTEFMERAVEQFRLGAPKEIVLGIGLCQARQAEKSYKYCKEELAINDIEQDKPDGNRVVNKIDIGDNYKSVFDILKESGEIF